MKSITLNIGGQDRVFQFGLAFLGSLLEKEELSIQEIGLKATENPYKWNPVIMYHSCAIVFFRNNEEVPFNSYDFADWIEQSGGFEGEVYKRFETAFSQSLTKDVPEDKTKKKVSKK